MLLISAEKTGRQGAFARPHLGRFVRGLRAVESDRWRSVVPAGVASLLAGILSACSPFPDGQTFTVTKECILPTDQEGTLSGRWKTLPIPLALEAEAGGGFPASEVEPIIAAADQWNTHFEAVIGQKVWAKP